MKPDFLCLNRKSHQRRNNYKKLPFYPLLTKLVVKTDNGKFTIGFDKILSGNFNNLKIGNDIIYKDYTGVANGTIKYDLSKGAILQIDIKEISHRPQSLLAR